MDDKEIKDLLVEEDDFSPLDLETEQAENICGDMTKVKPPAQVFAELPQPLGTDLPLEFMNLVSKVHAMYRIFPLIDHEATYDELVGLTVKVVPTQTLQMLTEEFHKVQAVKERLSEIMVQLGRIHSFKKRQVEILKESWIKFSKESSADKRKADAIYRISEFESDYLAIDGLWRTANHILQNLASTQEILSRRVTIINLEVRMRDLGRNSVPDYSFRGEALGDTDIGNPVEIDDVSEVPQEGDPTEAEEMEF